MKEDSKISPQALRVIRVTDEIVLRLAKHWLGLAIVILFVFQALPWSAPFLMNAGYVDQAGWIYGIYAPTCHQLAYRSYFLFGEQNAYTVAELQNELHVEHPASDLLFWRGVIGNEQMGFKSAYCERDTAIYTTLLLALIGFGILRRVRPLKPPSTPLFIALFVLPIALDGLSQLLGFRESNPLLRTLTGAWFAIGVAWFILPRIETAMQELYAQTAQQLKRVHARAAQHDSLP